MTKSLSSKYDEGKGKAAVASVPRWSKKPIGCIKKGDGGKKKDAREVVVDARKCVQLSDSQIQAAVAFSMKDAVREGQVLNDLLKFTNELFGIVGTKRDVSSVSDVDHGMEAMSLGDPSASDVNHAMEAMSLGDRSAAADDSWMSHLTPQGLSLCDPPAAVHSAQGTSLWYRDFDPSEISHCMQAGTRAHP